MANLPTERIVLWFGIGIAAAAYLYWSALGFSRGEGWSSVPALRALGALAGITLLTVLLRLIRSIDES